MTDQAIQNESNPNEESNNEHLKGLGGWLILVGLGIILAPIKICIFLYANYNEFFKSGAWEFLTTPGSEYFVPHFDSILIAEISINVLLLIAILYAGYLFFSKKAAFPKWYIGIILFSLSFIVIDALVVSSIIPDTEAFDKETLRELGRVALAAMIWVPYMIVSHRVKATFVNV